MISGVKWTSASAALLFWLGLLQTAVLAHLLRPKDFGLVAAALVVVGLAQAFADLGISSAIIARQTSAPETLSSLYWASILGGAGMFVVVVASTPLAVSFYHEPRLRGVLPWAASIFLITPVGQQFQMLLEKELQFDRLAKIEIAASVFGLLVAVSAAEGGAGALSLVWGALSRAVVMASLLAYRGRRLWRPRLRLRRRDVNGYIGFGLYQMGERSLNFLTANIDYLLIGRYLGLNALGAYAIAYQLIVKPLFQLNPVLTRVAFPAFARKQTDDAALRRGYCEMIRLIAFIVMPAFTALVVVAPLFIPVAFGERWHRSILIVQILTIVGITKALANPVGSILLAKNRPDIGFKINAGLLVLVATVLWLVVRSGVVAVAIAQAGIAIGTFMIEPEILRRMIKLSWAQFFSVLRWPAFNSACAGAVMVATYLGLRPVLHGREGALIAVTAVGIVSYLAFVLVDDRRYLAELKALFRTGRAAQQPPSPEPSLPPVAK